MKFEIKFYINGKLKETKVTKTEFDWKWLDRLYYKYIKHYLKLGYKEVHGSSNGYTVFFNEKLMKSTVVSYRMRQMLDFTDSNGKPIIEGKIYTGLLQGQKLSDNHLCDRYSVNESYDGRLYIRNITRSDSHVVDRDGHPMMSPTVKDKFDFDQQYIDTLNLKAL